VKLKRQNETLTLALEEFEGRNLAARQNTHIDNTPSKLVTLTMIPTLRPNFCTYLMAMHV
jgi:hypothetical protein